jgi:hypothetical protein
MGGNEMNEELSDKSREQFAIKRKESLLKETKKDIDMLVNQYALAYSTKDTEAKKFMEMYYDTVSEMKERIITRDPRFFSFVMDSKKLSSKEKLAIYSKKKKFLDSLPDDGLNDYLAKPNNFLNNPKLLFSVKAEKIIREYFKEASGTSFDEFEKQCAKLASSFIIMYEEHAQRKSPVSIEPTNFDPKEEIQAMYKQLNKNKELKEQKKEQIKEQLIKYLTEQLKEQKSFYDVSDSENFAKWGISNMTDMFKKNPEKVEINLETIKTKVLEDRKKELEKELKKRKKYLKILKMYLKAILYQL